MINAKGLYDYSLTINPLIKRLMLAETCNRPLLLQPDELHTIKEFYLEVLHVLVSNEIES